MKNILVITLSSFLSFIVINCNQDKIKYKIPKSVVKFADHANVDIYGNLSFIEYEKFNSIYFEFSNQTAKNFLLNAFLFPVEFIKVEKRINGQFKDISEFYFKRSDITWENGFYLGEGDTSARNILGPEYYNYNNQNWFKNHNNLNDLRDTLEKYLLQNTKKDSSCINVFLYELNGIRSDSKIGMNIYINKSFKKGSVYKIYFSYPDILKKSMRSFCYDLFDSLPPIKDFEIYKGIIVSDTLYLNCE